MGLPEPPELGAAALAAGTFEGQSVIVTGGGTGLGKAIALGFKIMLYTAQRPGDVRAMGWSQYNGDTITIRQQKTGKLVEVPCVTALRQALDAARAQTTGTVMVAGPDGTCISEGAWRPAFNIIRRKAGLHVGAWTLQKSVNLRMVG